MWRSVRPHRRDLASPRRTGCTSLATGQPTGILYTSAPLAGSYEGLVPALYGDGQAQHWFLVLDPEQFGWVHGGRLVPFPIKASAGLMGIDW
jgi:hypothetical protein